MLSGVNKRKTEGRVTEDGVETLTVQCEVE